MSHTPQSCAAVHGLHRRCMLIKEKVRAGGTHTCQPLFLCSRKDFPLALRSGREISLQKIKKITHAQAGIIQDMKQWKDWGGGEIRTYQLLGHVLLSCGNHCKSQAFVLLRLQNVACSRTDALRSFLCMLRFLQVCLHRALSPSPKPTPPAPLPSPIHPPPAPVFFPLPVSHGRCSFTHSPISNHRRILIPLKHYP